MVPTIDGDHLHFLNLKVARVAGREGSFGARKSGDEGCACIPWPRFPPARRQFRVAQRCRLRPLRVKRVRSVLGCHVRTTQTGGCVPGGRRIGVPGQRPSSRGAFPFAQQKSYRIGSGKCQPSLDLTWSGTHPRSGVSLATIWRDLRGFTGAGSTCGAN